MGRLCWQDVVHLSRDFLQPCVRDPVLYIASVREAARNWISLAMRCRSGRMGEEAWQMEERPVYENTFNQAARTERRFRWIALASSLLAGTLLAAYLLQ